MIISIRNLFSAESVIAAGAATGSDHFTKIVAQILPEVNKTRVELPVILDLSAIDDATPSYIKATVLALHQCGRRFVNAITMDEHAEVSAVLQPLNIIVAVLNASFAVQECIHEVFARRGLAILAGSSLFDDRFESAVVLGQLDEKIFETLQLACGFEEFQAGDLLEKNNPTEPGIKVTGWNNRLAELHRQRLLLRRTEGRANRFRSFANKVISHGQILLR